MPKSSKRPDPVAQALVMRLTPLGEVRVRSMFGGFGFYADDLFFALLMQGQLYFKIDDTSRPVYERHGVELFRPAPDRPDLVFRYCRVPDAVFDGPDLIAWGEAAIGTARRDREKKKAKAAKSAWSRR